MNTSRRDISLLPNRVADLPGRAVLLVIASFVLAAGISAAPARADVREQVRGCVARILKRTIVDPWIADLSGERLVVRVHGRHLEESRATLGLGRSLGAGFSGRVYELSELTGAGIVAGVRNEDLVVKMSHRSRFSKEVKAKAAKDSSLLKESRTYDLVMKNAEEIWRDPVMKGKEASWTPGTLPIAKLYRTLETDHGVFLIKSKIKGEGLRELAAKYGTDPVNFPVEVKQSLRDVFDLAQAVHRQVKVHPADVLPPGAPAKKLAEPVRGFAADIKPENFIWVTDPHVLAQHGMRRSGFLFVEFTHHGGPRYAYDEAHLTYGEYQKIFGDYLRFNSPR